MSACPSFLGLPLPLLLFSSHSSFSLVGGRPLFLLTSSFFGGLPLFQVATLPYVATSFRETFFGETYLMSFNDVSNSSDYHSSFQTEHTCFWLMQTGSHCSLWVEDWIFPFTVKFCHLSEEKTSDMLLVVALSDKSFHLLKYAISLFEFKLNK